MQTKSLKRLGARYRPNQPIVWHRPYWPALPSDGIDSYSSQGLGWVKEARWIDIRPDGSVSVLPGWVYLVQEYSLSPLGKYIAGEEDWYMEEQLWPQTRKKIAVTLEHAPKLHDRIQPPPGALRFDPALALSEPLRDQILNWYRASKLMPDDRFQTLVKEIALRLLDSWHYFYFSEPTSGQLALEGMDRYTQPYLCEVLINKDWVSANGLLCELEINPDRTLSPVYTVNHFAESILQVLGWNTSTVFDTANADGQLEISFYSENFSYAKILAGEGICFGVENEVLFIFYERNLEQDD